MTQILLISNPFQPFKDLQRHFVPAGNTIRGWLQEHFGPEFVEFDRPTVCQHNGEMLMREQWDRVLKDEDVLAFVTLPGGTVVAIVLAIVSVVVAVAAVLLMPDPKIPQDNTPGPDSVYTLRGQTNRFRPNEPIEVSYGRVRHWPTFIARPYSEYIGNEQYQYSLFCLGQGEFDVHAFQLEDTPTTDFDEVELQVCAPGEAVTLVESAVTTSLEVSNIELLGPNEEEYVGPAGPFVLNPFDTPIHRIAVDISFPRGLFYLDKKGRLMPYAVLVLFEYQEIDAAGVAVGDWQTLVGTEGEGITISQADNTPLRITYSKVVPAGRYRIRGDRITANYNGLKEGSTLIWEAAKGYARGVGTFGNLTVVAMRAKATNSLNDNSNRSFNVIMTRKLPTWTPADGWLPASATRNPVWAMCDVFRAEYGAKLPAEYLDMPTLYELAEVLEDGSLWFDWTFDSPITVWEAAVTIMRVARSIPVPQGSMVTAVRDVAQTLPAAVFNQHNIVSGSLTKKLALFEFQPKDGLVVEYTDPDTWKTKEVRCILPGRSGLNLDRVKLPGCTDRARAYREGMYIQTRKELQRKTVEFRTGLEGHIPAYMDLVSVTHDTVRVGQGGIVLAYDSPTKTMTLSEQVTFTNEYLNHKIVLRGDDGAPNGLPITVTPGPTPNKVVLAEDPPDSLDFSSDRVPPLYAFGVEQLWSFLGKVARISPIGTEAVELTLVNYVPDCYNYDAATPDLPVDVGVIRDPSNPAIAWVTITPVVDREDRIFIDWLPMPGSASYVVQVSYDGGLWTPCGTFPSPPVQMSVNPGTVEVRVAPFSLSGNVRYTVSNSYVVGSNIAVPAAPVPADPQPDFVGMGATPTWGTVPGVYGYNVDVFLADGTTLLRSIAVGSALSTTYTLAMLQEDTLTQTRTLKFSVAAYNAGGEGDPVVITLTNPAPVNNLTGFTVGAPSGSVYPCLWAHEQEDDFQDYRVFTSTTDGFTPGPGNLAQTVTDKFANINAPTRPLYVVVGVRDVWGPELQLSSQYVIP